MKLFFASLQILARFSIKPICSIVIFTVAVFAIFFSFNSAVRAEILPQILVVNLDKNPLTGFALNSLSHSTEIKEVAQISVVSSDTATFESFSAKLVLQDGFADSVLNGSNHSILLFLNNAGYIENAVIKSLAGVAASNIRAAQKGVYSANLLLHKDAAISLDEKELLIIELNLFLMEQFARRFEHMQKINLSLFEQLPYAVYYFLCSISLFLFFYTALFYSSIHELKVFAKNTNKTASQVFSAVYFWHFLIFLSLLLTSLFFLKFSTVFFIAVLLLSALLASFCVFLGSVFASRQSALIFSGFFCLTLAFVSGSFVPLALLPKYISTLADFSPLYCSNRLFFALYSGALTENTAVFSLCFTAFFICVAFVFFKSKRGAQ